MFVAFQRKSPTKMKALKIIKMNIKIFVKQKLYLRQYMIRSEYTKK